MVKMEKKWTAAQMTAITERDRTLLISAAAGSGKTATLTERIIRTITDPENPADLSRMLIVTFTKAAAAELKERISTALSNALAKNPTDKNLLKQFMLLPSAKISTIHSFCLDIVRANYQILGLNPNFRIDDAEADLISKEIMNDLLNEYYDAPDSKTAEGAMPFPVFVDQLIGAKEDDRLSDILLSLYKKLSSYPGTTKLLLDYANRLREEAPLDFFATRHGEAMKKQIFKGLSHYKTACSKLLPILAANQNTAKSYLPTFERDLDYIRDFERAICGGYKEAAGFLAENAVKRLGPIKTELQTEQSLYAKDLHGDFNKFVKSLREIDFSLTPEQITETATKTAEFCHFLYLIMSEFEKRLRHKKILNSLCSFSDLEHYALELLYENGEPTPLARDIARQFDAIYIDEYQDINSVQDRIFRCISQGRNRFMVGDIKQSIYAFRGANPDIFAKMRSEYPPLETATETDDAAAIFMSNNFRCDRPIINFVNTIFECLFTHGSKQLAYRKEDSLIFGKTPTDNPNKVKVVIVDTAKKEDEKRPLTEPEYVASEIKRLIQNEKKNDGSPIRPGDITILLRNANVTGRQYEKALERVGVPYYSEIPGDFFENAEVSLVMSLLNSIDNPRNDICLAGTLCSPLFGFTLDELIEIRRFTQPDLPLYDALESYCALYNYPKGENLLQTLKNYRTLAQGMPVDKLLWRLYRDTSILSLVKGEKKSSADIRVRRTNLMLLYEYARKYEAGSFKGLYSFIKYVNGIIEEGKRLEAAKPSGESDDTVKIMSIHKSKGLEFPVCFLCGAQRRHSNMDTRNNLLFDYELGPAVRLRDDTGLARCDTPHRRAVASSITGDQIEEELRVLYVALTRARERLYVTAAGKAENLLSKAGNYAQIITEYSISNISNYMEWILTALKLSPTPACEIEVICDRSQIYTEPVTEQAPLDTETAQNTVLSVSKDYENTIYNTLVKRFSFKYPYAHMSRIPAKLSVSKLYPGVLDETEGNIISLEIDEMTGIPEQRSEPAFISGQRASNAADSGTATHLFMQFCDFDNFVKKGTKSEIERLIERRYISQEIAQLINLTHIQLFAESDLLIRLRNATKLYRELRFNLKLPASLFTKDQTLASLLEDEELLVQGVIDCIFEEPDGKVSLVDYKTDFLTPFEIAHPKAAEEKLITRHRQQLSYYAAATSRMLGRRVDRISIYSLPLGREIEITV